MVFLGVSHLVYNLCSQLNKYRSAHAHEVDRFSSSWTKIALFVYYKLIIEIDANLIHSVRHTDQGEYILPILWSDKSLRCFFFVMLTEVISDKINPLTRLSYGGRWSTHIAIANARQVGPLPDSSGLGCPFWSTLSSSFPNTSPVARFFCRTLVIPAPSFWPGSGGE